MAVSGISWDKNSGTKSESRHSGQPGLSRRRSTPETSGFLERCRGWLGAHRRGLGVVCLLLLFIVGVKLSLHWVIHRPFFRIQHTVIRGNLHQVDQALVAKAVQRVQGDFFTVDLGAAAAELKTIPWVRAVHLHRIWPNALEVQVEEQIPAAYWGDEGLLNIFGEPFVADYLGELPHFVGPSEAGPEMLQAWNKFNHDLEPLGRHVEGMVLSERGAWTLTLDDGSHWLLGREPNATRWQRFLKVWPELHQNGVIPAGGTVDLRYANGFTVRGPRPVSKED
ncbi:cell division protein FtsQ/DivIB [Ferrovum sp.]|uniref:cell division protein FtsQ/DivIB n=1 Tax=Ferrovum sp. TaxID=2609467 RepID=UPI002633702C|nr:cell division protein FtsQ/DivIB [Ferrovum sp.]